LKRSKLPSLRGTDLIRLLKADGWQEGRYATHGMTLTKRFGERTRVTFIPPKRGSLPEGTLMAILSDKQTGLGKNGLLELIDKFS